MKMPHNALSGYADQLESGFFERRLAIELMIVSSIANESVFLCGPPGTAKSLMARSLKNLFPAARYFEHLLGKFSLPEDLFGPISIKSLTENDEYTRNFEGYLPSAEIVFLDEVWKASPVIQNFILSAINEKIFHNGNRVTEVPLRVLISASNEVPEGNEQEAFWDRLLVRIPISPIESLSHFTSMVESSPKHEPNAQKNHQTFTLSPDEWSSLTNDATKTPFDPGISSFLFRIRKEMAKVFGKRPSDRRLLKIFGLAKAHAFLVGNPKLSIADMSLGIFCLWNKVEDIPAIKQIFESEMSRFLLDSGTVARASDHVSLQQKNSKNEFYLFEDEYLELLKPDFVAIGQTVRLWKDDYDQSGDRVEEVELLVYEGGLFVKTLIIKGVIDKSKATLLFENKVYDFRKANPVVTESNSRVHTQSGDEIYKSLLSFRSSLEKEFNTSTITRFLDFGSIIKPIDKKIIELGVALELD